MIKYIDNGILCGWYFCIEGEFYGDGTKAGAIAESQEFCGYDELSCGEIIRSNTIKQ